MSTGDSTSPCTRTLHEAVGGRVGQQLALAAREGGPVRMHDGGAQAARGQPPGPVQDPGLGLGGLGRVEQAGGGGDDPGLAQAHDAVAQRGLRAGNVGVQVTRGSHQLISTEPGLSQRARHLIGGELGVLGLEITARQLADFALMGAAMARAVLHIERPRVGLLNIGVEEIKGVEEVRQAHAWLKENAIRYGPLELVIEWEIVAGGKAGLKLFKGAEEETAVGVDREQGRVYLDRTHSGNVTFHPKFSGVHAAPMVRNDRLKLRIFVDACSIEVFVNDGERVLTDLVFPSQNSRDIEFFGPKEGTKLSALDVWSLRSSWN